LDTEKLYSPLFVKIAADESDEDYEGDYWNDPLSQQDAVYYKDEIHAAILKERMQGEEARGLMTYYHDGGAVDEKVRSMFIDVEVHDGKLWGVATLEISEPLTPDELDDLKDYLSGQYSDGFGEGFEQRGIKVSDGELFVSLWESGNAFFIDTQQEFADRLGLDYLAPTRDAKPSTPAQAPLDEPDASEDADTAALQERLDNRLFLKLTDYLESLQGRDPVALVDNSLEISAMTYAYYYMSEIHGFKKSELEYLLRFQDPLRVVANEFEWENAVDNRSEVMRNVFHKQEALRSGRHPLLPDAAEIMRDPLRSSPEMKDKPSVMEQIRRAAKEAQERPSAPKDTPGQKKAGPEL